LIDISFEARREEEVEGKPDDETTAHIYRLTVHKFLIFREIAGPPQF
jgi:hypothetical protein